MINTQPMTTLPPQDEELVRGSLAGDRAAFAQIVARYQSLLCSLAFSATGSLARSEDLAQETFVAAWKQLPALREPGKLRAWLCGIARHVISNAQRRAGREPSHLAESLELSGEIAAAEPSPPEQAVRREEEALLWQALANIPETYREPLVLFYREHRSTENVARELDLTEEAVRQRLSRGRALLQDQVVALVEGALERSRPGRAFTGSVLSVLPALGTGTVATGAGAVAAQGSAGSKLTSWAAPLGALLTAQVLWFLSSVAFVAGLGAFAGWQMGDPAASAEERRWTRWLWRFLAVGLVAVGLPSPWFENLGRSHPHLIGILQAWFILFYLVVGVALSRWAWENHRRLRSGRPAGGGEPAASDPLFRRWVLAATLGFGGMLVLGFSASNWSTTVRSTEVWDIVEAHPGAEIRVDETTGGARWIRVDAVGQSGAVRVRGPLDEDTFRRLQQSGRPYHVRREGRDYDVLGWPGRRLGLVTILTFSAGMVLLWRTRRSRQSVSAG